MGLVSRAQTLNFLVRGRSEVPGLMSRTDFVAENQRTHGSVTDPACFESLVLSQICC